MKKTLTVASLCMIVSITMFAQPSFTVMKKEAAKQVSQKILVVVLQEPDPKTEKRLAKKPDDLKAHRESVVTFNELLKEAVAKDWTLSKEIKYVTKTEADKLRESKDKDVCLLFLTDVKNYKMNDFYSPNPSFGFNRPRDLAYHMSPAGESVALALAFAASPNDEIAVSYLPALGISKSTVSFMVRNLQNQIRDGVEKGVTKLGDLKDEIEKKRPDLKNKTLLIFDPLISNSLQKTLDKKGLDKFYNHKYEVVSLERAEELILSKDPGYAFIWVIPAGAVSGGRVLFNYFIIDAADARPMYLTGTAVAGANGQFHEFHFHKVNKKIE